MLTCSNCLLNDNIPSVTIGDSGLCNYCSGFMAAGGGADGDDREFRELLDRYADRKYQVLMAFSGGKDSTYTLKLIKEKYNASILAVTFNNGFLSPSGLRNAGRVTDYLGVDSIVVKYPVHQMVRAFRLAEDGGIFPRISLERASAICNLCIMLIKNMTYYEAIIRNIPIICFGWTPGQTETARPILKLDYRMVSKVFETVRKAVARELGPQFGSYFLDGAFMEQNEDRMPYLHYPFVRNPYNEEAIIEDIRQIGWELPDQTDGNSSNCLLNSYANQRHIERYGYHPYTFEISGMIRSGCMTRDAGAAKLANSKNDGAYEMIRRIFDTG